MSISFADLSKTSCSVVLQGFISSKNIMFRTHKKFKGFFFFWDVIHCSAWLGRSLADFSSQLYIGEPILSLYKSVLEGLQKDWSLHLY